MLILHRDLKPHNFLLARNRKDKLLLADFGGTKDEERAGKYSKECEVYAFGVCAHYLIWGQPLFSNHNVQDYLNNKTKSENCDVGDGFLLQGIINWCLDDEPA